MIRFFPSETAGPLIFSTNVKDEAFFWIRAPGSRTNHTFRRLRQKKATANKHDFQVEEERMESGVMDAKG